MRYKIADVILTGCVILHRVLRGLGVVVTRCAAVMRMAYYCKNISTGGVIMMRMIASWLHGYIVDAYDYVVWVELCLHGIDMSRGRTGYWDSYEE